jgi:hypothetical protein
MRSSHLSKLKDQSYFCWIHFYCLTGLSRPFPSLAIWPLLINVFEHFISNTDWRNQFILTYYLCCYFMYCYVSLIGRSTMLQAGMSRIRSPMSLDVLINLILPKAIWPLDRQLLTEMSARNLKAGGGGVEGDRRVRLTSPLLWADCLDNVRASTPYNPMGLRGLLQIALHITVLCECGSWYRIQLEERNIDYGLAERMS